MRFIGNKTQLLDNIKEVVDRHAPEAHSFCDIFSGTASVARFFKQWYEVYSNDLLYFSYCLQRATIENPCKPTFELLSQALGIHDPISYFNEMSTECMEALPVERRFFQNNYAPIGGRMYITDSNALRIDFARNTIEDWNHAGFLSPDEYYYLVACVVEGVPFVSNIAGTYGAFNKTWDVRSNKLFVLIDLPVVNNGLNNRSYNEDGTMLLKRISGDMFLSKLKESVELALPYIKFRGYVVLFIKDLQPSKKEPNLLHADVVNELNTIPNLYYKGMKIWADESTKLYPYGYPFSFVSNQIHQYILVFRKEK